MICHDILSLNMGKIHSYAQWPEGKIWTRIVHECLRSVHEIWLRCEAKIGLGDGNCGNGSTNFGGEFQWPRTLVGLFNATCRGLFQGCFSWIKSGLLSGKVDMNGYDIFAKMKPCSPKFALPPQPSKAPTLCGGAGQVCYKVFRKNRGSATGPLKKSWFQRLSSFHFWCRFTVFRSGMERFYSLHTSVSLV